MDADENAATHRDATIKLALEMTYAKPDDKRALGTSVNAQYGLALNVTSSGYLEDQIVIAQSGRYKYCAFGFKPQKSDWSAEPLIRLTFSGSAWVFCEIAVSASIRAATRAPVTAIARHFEGSHPKPIFSTRFLRALITIKAM